MCCIALCKWNYIGSSKSVFFPTPIFFQIWFYRLVVFFRLESLESGAHDPTKFLKWQNEMRQKDLEAELAAVERRRLEGMMSHEDAILARQKLIGDNQKKVEEMKQETKELMQR